MPGLTAQRKACLEDVRTPAMGADVTNVRVKGEWLQLGLTVDDVTGLVLTLDDLAGADAETLKEWITPIAEAVGAELLVTDDADAFKAVADALDLGHQVCISYVTRNTQALADELLDALTLDTDGSLRASGVTAEQAVADLRQIGAWLFSRQPEQVEDLESLHRRYIRAAAPRPGEQATLAYRMRLLTLDRWALWPRLTRYRTWQGANGERVDGTNNACERAIGWWIRERYRTMRGYKRKASAVNVSRLIAFCGNRLDRGGVDLARLVA
ncbi:MAG: IS66 family transposase [Anaerolineae bacterium]